MLRARLVAYFSMRVPNAKELTAIVDSWVLTLTLLSSAILNCYSALVYRIRPIE